ncbi:MAG TPA: NAD(P)-dependent oxidoreductase [Polyangia bacterium]|jgi:D-3-phosphoglycerate dehydrogenase|nr:NAD(P)-dependent oxidoreductase [Polyangia bacterium]
MRILIADSFSEGHLNVFRGLGLDVDYQPSLTKDQLPSAIRQAAILVVRSTEVTAQTIEAGEELALIVRAGAGYNTIDCKAASGRGVYVANCPGKNAIAVAELTLGLLLSLDRRIPDAVADLRAGKWNKKEYSRADGLFGRTLGVIGTGSIGREVIRRAQAFGLQVLAWSRSLDDEGARQLGVERTATVPELCGRSDAVTLHVALTQETRGFIGEAALGRMRPRTLLINTSRAELVDGRALRKAIAERNLRVALDVFEHEPGGATGSFGDEIVQLPGVYGTHHIGASTEQAQAAIAEETVRIVRAFVERGEVPNCVNLRAKSPAKFQLNVRHLDQVGVLAEVLGAIRRHNINVEEMVNTIFDGGVAACASIRLAARPPGELLDEIRTRPTIIHANLVELG